MPLRLRVIMIFIQSGISLLPCLFRSRSFRVWCICTSPLAPHISQVLLSNLSINSDRLWIIGVST